MWRKSETQTILNCVVVAVRGFPYWNMCRIGGDDVSAAAS